MQTTVLKVAKGTRKKRQIAVQAACGVCRSRKLACDGRRPRCSRCQTRGELECSYDTERPEETRTHAMKRKVEDMQAQLDRVSQALTALKDLPEDGAARLLADVLSDPNPLASLIEVGKKIQVQSSNLSQQISLLNSMQATFPNTKSCVQFELYLYFPKWYPSLTADEVRLLPHETGQVDFFKRQTARTRHLSLSPQFSPTSHAPTPDGEQQPGFRIAYWNVWVRSDCLSFWTDVPISVGLAERAINAYLRTDHVLFGFMDTEFFLRDFVRCEDRYCSVALVNAVLHYGCMKIARCDDEAASAVDAFEKETVLTLRNDSSLGVPRIAALNVHYVAVIFGASYEQGVPFLSEAIALCDVLYGWSKPSPEFESWCQTPEDERALSHVVWSVSCSAVYRTHRWRSQAPPSICRLPVPFLELSTRSIVKLPEAVGADLDKISCERYILAAVFANLPFVQESVMLNLESLSDEERASRTASIYRRALENTASIPRPSSLHAALTDIAAISQMWSHFWILGLFQPLTHYNGAIPGFQASGGTAGAIFAASARQLQHLVFVYQRYHILAPPTVAWHGPIFVAAVALTQVRRVVNRAEKFEALLWLFADLATSFPGLRQLMQSLALTGYGADLVDLQRIRVLFRRFSEICKHDRKADFQAASVPAADSRKNDEMATALREKSYDYHFVTSHVIDLSEDEEEPST